MAAKSERSAKLSVLDRLIDLEPKRASEPPPSAAQSLRELKASLRRDITFPNLFFHYAIDGLFCFVPRKLQMMMNKSHDAIAICADTANEFRGEFAMGYDPGGALFIARPEIGESVVFGW